jgi:hypothetical protein
MRKPFVHILLMLRFSDTVIYFWNGIELFIGGLWAVRGEILHDEDSESNPGQLGVRLQLERIGR